MFPRKQWEKGSTLKPKARSENKHVGWTVSPNLYRFEHIPIDDANKRSSVADRLHVVETVNWTYAERERAKVHLNRYIAMNLPEAVGLASALALRFLAGEIAESVVAVRPATEQEERDHWEAYDALGEEQAVLYD